ncbi:DUF2934 domain-containing protein [Pseudomonas sp. CM25]|uniref:DUF2934 domain-containing protein n=1 Tax=unclassified Pseudomonas TaxID=196821 RepID=UPI001557E618|nr:DUF2934 domain-containing protein [Pseudomonas sp. CM25]NQD78293.1 DUF2934 domain-containing protein [Pseudomonas sp. CM27]HEN8800698.1 DUF2934 domain-containing protein [Pseudomonas putida]
MMSVDEKRVREFAYQIWESEGKPEGQEDRHWDMARKLAEAEALAPEGKGKSAAKAKVAAKPKAAASAKPAAAPKPPAEPKVAALPGVKPAAAKKPRAAKKPTAG